MSRQASHSKHAPIPASVGPLSPIEFFVEQMAVDLGLGTGSSDRRTRRQLFRLTEWATGEGIALDRERVLDPDTVERFIASLGAERSAATYRAALRRVGPLLTKKAPWEPRPTAIARRQLAPPYGDEEISILFDDAQSQPTVPRMRSAMAMLALGLGVGLDGRWVTRVAGTDVAETELGVLVKVGEPNPRVVVAIDVFAETLLELAALAKGEFLVGGRSASKNRTAQLTERLVTPTGHPKLAPARLRSTWLRWQIESGTRLPELCRAAGLQGTGVLADLLGFIEPACDHVTAVMLRGAFP